MTTSPQEELRQLLANQLSPSSGRPRNLFGPDEIPPTQVHGAAAETQLYTPAPQEQELLQLRSDLTAFQATVSAQYNNLMDLVSNIAAASSANYASAAASPANSAAASTAKSASSPAASTANAAASTANFATIPPTPSGSPKPSALLLAKQHYAITNPALFENDGRFRMTTPSTVCERVKKLKPGVWSALDDAPGPGLEAELALDNLKFESMAIFPAMTECEWAGELVEALTQEPKRDRSRLVQNLLKVAVRCGTVQLIDAQIAQIKATGLFDRKLAAAGDLRLETRLQLFDPSTQDGKHLWDAIGRLITAYFSRSRSGDQGRQIAEHEYAELTCDSHESVSIFLCTEADCYDDVTRTGASYTGYTRIQLVLLKLPGHLQTAYAAFKGRCKENCQWNDSRSTDFDMFASDIELVAMSMPPDAGRNKQGDQAAPDTCYARKLHTDRKPGRTASSDHCWNHQFTAECRFGDDCKFDHVGEAGCFKLEVADEHGRCLMEQKPGGCRRNNCSFVHREESGQPKPRGMYPILPRSKQFADDQSGSNMSSVNMYHFGIKQCPVY